MNGWSKKVLIDKNISFLKETPYPTIGRFQHVEGSVGRELKSNYLLDSVAL